MQRRVKTLAVIAKVALFCLVAAAPAWGAIFYVSPEGADHNPGTQEAPIATLNAASLRASAGDTVIFLPGTYPGVLRPVHSGTADAPIRFMASEPGQAVLVGAGGNFTVSIVGVSYITIEGFYMNPQADTGRWIWLKDATHITIANNLMENAIHGTMPFHITYSEQIFVRGNVMRRLAPDRLYEEQTELGLFRIGNSQHVLFEGNAVGRTSHHLMTTDPPGTTANIVVRGNVFHAEHSRNVVFFATSNTLFQDNIIVSSYKGGRSMGSNSRFHVEGGIFRFNRIYYNWGGALNLYPDPIEQFPGPVQNLRFYNNVFDRNVDYGIAIYPRERMADVVFTNNIFTGNDFLDDHDQIVFVDATPEQVSFVRNVVFNGISDGVSYGNSSPATVADTLNVDPLFADPYRYDHSLAPDSPLRDAGQFLTHTVSSGSGTQIDVADSWYFYDGFGLEGEQGDLIFVGAGKQPARILTIDRTQHRITVDRPLVWAAGDPVSLPWSGSAPDIGVYEHGDDGRASIQIDQSAFSVVPGAPVHLRPVSYGPLEPVAYHWILGDGTTSASETLQHSYPRAGEYPLLLRVEDKAGYSYFATAYVVVKEPRNPDAPLLHTTFDADDVEWWQDWRANYPLPSQWDRILDQTTDAGYFEVLAPTGYDEPIGTLHSWVRPANWRIDEYPYVAIRYCVFPGSPVAVYLDGFEERDVYVASTLAHRDSSTPRIGSDYLIDDGQWHELVIDARTIRERYPDTIGLEGIGLRSGSELSRVGQGYRLDEVAILPASYDFSNRLQLAAKTLPAEPNTVGTTALQLQAVVPAGDRIETVELQLAGKRVYQGPTLPDLFHLDTSEVTDGTHLLTYSVFSRNGQSKQIAIPIVVANTWSLVDQCMPPVISPFLGSVDFALTAEESLGWRIATTNPAHYDHDPHRKVRLQDTTEYLIWETPNLRTISVTLYTTLDAGERFVAMAVASKAGLWTPVDFSVEARDDMPAAIQRVVLSALVPAAISADWFRFTLLPSNAAPEAIQIGEVRLSGWGVLGL